MKEPVDASANGVDQGRRNVIKWLWRVPVVSVLVGALYALYEVYKIQFRKLKPSELPRFVRGERVEVARLHDLDHIWDSAEFSYENVPALVMRLPEPVAGSLTLDVSPEGGHFIAFSRICTHQGCIVKLNTNTELIAVSYNYRSSEPALACNCHFSVFMPTKAGQAVSGPAVKPLPRIKLEASRTHLYATGIEKS